MDRPIYPAPKPEPKKKGGKGPRQQGNRVERMVSKETGGKRVPMSGGAKHFATGDVEIPDADGKPLVKLEVKACGVISAKGEKSYALSQKVLEQMVKEADNANEIGALWLHFKGQALENGYLIMQAKHWTRFLELAKLGATMEK